MGKIKACITNKPSFIKMTHECTVHNNAQMYIMYDVRSIFGEPKPTIKGVIGSLTSCYLIYLVPVLK